MCGGLKFGMRMRSAIATLQLGNHERLYEALKPEQDLKQSSLANHIAPVWHRR